MNFKNASGHACYLCTIVTRAKDDDESAWIYGIVLMACLSSAWKLRNNAAPFVSGYRGVQQGIKMALE